MKKLIIAGALVSLGSLCLQDISSGHGGTYRGPGDTVPPAGGGGGGGGPSNPGPGSPGTPGPSAPGTPGPAAPGTAPSTPRGPSSAPQTGKGAQGADLTVWSFWWGFNKDPYLNLKAHIHDAGPHTGSDDFFLGTNAKRDGKDTLRPSEETVRNQVVPALLEALKKEKADHILTGAMVALAKIGDVKSEDGKSEFTEAIKPFLEQKASEVSETAAVALGILQNDSAETIDLLSLLLTDNSAKVRDVHKVNITGEVEVRVRAFAAYGLGLIGYKSADYAKRAAIVNTLTKALEKSSRSSTRDIPVACIVSLGLVPLPYDAADDAVKSDKPTELKNRCEQIRMLLDYYKDENNEFLNRSHVPTALARLLADVPAGSKLHEATAKMLLATIEKRSKEKSECQQSAVLALGQLGDCDADAIDAEIRKSLLAVSENLSDDQARYFALIAAAQVGGRAGTGEGEALAGAKEVRKFLTESLGGKGKGNSASWAGLSIGVMERALLDAGQPTSADMRKALENALADAKSPNDVGAYAIGLGLMKNLDARLILREKLEKVSDNDARGYLAVGLGLMGDREAVKQITDIINKSKYQADMLRSAAIGLGLLGDKLLVPELVIMLGQAKSQSSQAAIASALGFIGDIRSVEPLVKFLQDTSMTDGARGFAAAALGIVADKEPLPWNSKISVNLNYRGNTPTLTSPEQGTGILDIL